MEYTEIGSTGVRVSCVCLGTVFRSEPEATACLATIQAAADRGINFLDVANVYRDGYSEEIVGKAIKGRRDQFVVTTKVGSPSPDEPSCKGLSYDAIMGAAEGSLKRLQTDRIDFYLCHFPDPEAPIEETLRAMDDLVRQGKVRFPGCSNFQGWRVGEALTASRQKGFASFACHQLLFNLLDRRCEDEIIPFCHDRGIGVTVFAATAIGLLSGRYGYGRPPPPGTSWHRGPYNFRAAMTRRTGEIIDTVVGIAEQRGKTPTEVAMTWCLSRPGVTSVIIGADTPERVNDAAGAVGWALTPEELERLDAVSEGSRMPVKKDCPEGYQADASLLAPPRLPRPSSPKA